MVESHQICPKGKPYSTWVQVSHLRGHLRCPKQKNSTPSPSCLLSWSFTKLPTNLTLTQHPPPQLLTPLVVSYIYWGSHITLPCEIYLVFKMELRLLLFYCSPRLLGCFHTVHLYGFCTQSLAVLNWINRFWSSSILVASQSNALLSSHVAASPRFISLTFKLQHHPLTDDFECWHFIYLSCYQRWP